MADQTELGFQFRKVTQDDVPQRMPVIPIRTARIVEVPRLAELDGQPRQLVIQLDDGSTGWLATPAGFASRAPKPGDYVLSWPDGSIGWLPGTAIDAHFDIPRPEPKPAERTVEPVAGGEPSGKAPDHPAPPEAGGMFEQQPETDQRAAGSAGAPTQPEPQAEA
jgi:hypothetical protein